jgi:hypothetical protein
MLFPAVKQAVSQRLVDDAISVRDAAVKLVGTFVVKSPEIANAFHSPLLKCLTDEGVSVKKRAVRKNCVVNCSCLSCAQMKESLSLCIFRSKHSESLFCPIRCTKAGHLHVP